MYGLRYSCIRIKDQQLNFSMVKITAVSLIDSRSTIKEQLAPFFMSIETTVLDFKLSNTFEEYEAHMNAPEQQVMFKEMGVKTFYIGKSLEDPKRATVMFQGPVNTCYDIFINPETKPIVEASGHIYEGTIINRWISY